MEEEIREINQQLIITIVNISEEDADSVAAASDGEGRVIKCSFTAVAFSPSLKSQFASLHMVSPILPLRLFVPANYPKCSPVLLGKLPDESRWDVKTYIYVLICQGNPILLPPQNTSLRLWRNKAVF